MLDAAVEDTVDSVAAASSGTHDELHASKGTTSSLADSNETGNDGGAAEAGSDNLDSAPSKSKKNQKKGKGSSTSQEVSSKLNAKKEEDHTRSQKID
nr:E3 UFM1-protein ligase 1 homolog isoform X1 [Ipomoea batatas]